MEKKNNKIRNIRLKNFGFTLLLTSEKLSWD